MRRFTPQLSKETLHSIALGPAIEWAEGGADSRDTLHLVLRLNSYLDRKISIDFIRRVQRLCSQLNSSFKNAAITTTGSFLLHSG